ncbi:MAG: PilT/PilU family type 4a pilus ATPase [Candidatus Omnitrophota bacterium]
MDINKNDEKGLRNYPRLAIELKFRYNMIGKNNELSNITHDGFTKDISAGGMRFETEEQMSIDTQLKILLKVPEAGEFEIIGKVIRIDKLIDISVYSIGVIFEKISDEQRNQIVEHLERMNILKLLEEINKEEISDLHLTVNSPPMIRSYGVIKPFGKNPLTAEQIKQMVYSILTDKQKEDFENNKDLDFAFSPSPDLRYRVNIYKQRGATEIVLRNIMSGTKGVEELGLPELVKELCLLKNGIIIIGGTTGSGKSTTISTMIDVINKTKGGVILSLEKPIEHLHKNIKAIVKQREVGVDVPSFASGLRAALRQDADVIIVGEILDADSMEAALEAAETGHLVITSIHATDTVQVFDRIVSLFPLESRNYFYTRLSHSLKAVIIQALLPDTSGKSRVLVTEVCTVNTAVKRMINAGEFTQLNSVIQTGSQYKMHTMQDSLNMLFEKGLISAETFEAYSVKTISR